MTPTLVVIFLITICLALFAWIIYDVRKSKSLKAENILAIVGLIVTVLVGIIPVLERAPAQPTPTPTLAATLAPSATPAPTATPDTRPSDTQAPNSVPVVRIVGPAEAPLKQTTYFTFVSENAARLESSIGGFTDGIQVVEPVAPSHQIFVEPKNPGTTGQVFVIRVTVYSKTNVAATAEHQFSVVK